ncbi:MAG TPA: hypothetical protein VFC19_05145 [Candidatus Limnocylindrales bacterium]|nr:hypothetical protein [Candidatus Limnocylindrales bacterium]
MTHSLRWHQAVRRRVALFGALLIGATLLTATSAGVGVAQAAAPPAIQAAPSSLISGVSRSLDKLDIFTVGPDNKIFTAAWQPEFSDGWHGWWHLKGGVAAPGTSVFAVSRRTDFLDVFAVGTDMGVYTAAWEPSFRDGWHGWWRVGSLTVAPGTGVYAVSNGLDRIDLFAIGSNRGIYTTGWSPSTGWAPWIQILGGVAAAGTNAYAVSRGAGKLDVFVVGTDRAVYTAAWDQASPGWRGWWRVSNLIVAPNTSVFPVTRRLDHLDVFAVGSDNKVYTAAWKPGDAAFQGWWRVGNLTARAGTTVFGVSRRTDHLDVFGVGSDNMVYTAAWKPGDNGFQGWWSVAGGVVAAGTSVFGVSRRTDFLDVFAIGTDNRAYTASWKPGDPAFQGWWNIPFPLLSIQVHGDIRFGGGVPVGGWLQASFYPNGAWNFSGHLRDSGFPNYDDAVGVVLKSSDGTAFVLRHTGRMFGTCCPGSRNDDWNHSGTNPALAAAWPALVAGHQWRWEAEVTLDIQGLIDRIFQIVGQASKVIVLL